MADQITVADIIEVAFPGLEVGEGLTKDALAEELSKRYVGVDLHKTQIDSAKGNAFGIAQTKFKTVLNGLGVQADNYKEFKTVDEFAGLAEAKVKELSQEITTLRASIEEAGKVNAGDAKYVELETKYKSIEQLLNKANEQIELERKAKIDTENEWRSKYENEKLNDEVNRLFDNANWTDDSDSVTKEGVKAVFINGKYQFKREGDKIHVYDKDGNVQTDGTNILTAEKLFEKTLKEAKRFKENKGNTKTTTVDAGAPQKTKEQLAYEEETFKRLGKV